MESNDRERYIDKIRKLFALAGNNPSEAAGERAGRDAVTSRRMTSGAPMLC